MLVGSLSEGLQQPGMGRAEARRQAPTLTLLHGQQTKVLEPSLTASQCLPEQEAGIRSKHHTLNSGASVWHVVVPDLPLLSPVTQPHHRQVAPFTPRAGYGWGEVRLGLVLSPDLVPHSPSIAFLVLPQAPHTLCEIRFGGLLGGQRYLGHGGVAAVQVEVLAAIEGDEE